MSSIILQKYYLSTHLPLHLLKSSQVSFAKSWKTNLQSEPLELGSNELVTRHDGVHVVLPVGAGERPTVGLRGLELRGVRLDLVVRGRQRVVGDVYVDHLAVF